MNSSASRLLVLVEDTAATRDLWPLWRQKVLEPVLGRIETADFGAYELNLVAFASVDGQSDALLRSGNWTSDLQCFRRYCDSLTFEGGAHENALGDALTEAVYCMQQPSALGPLHEVRQHVLLCWTGSVGHRPILWPLLDARLKGDDAQVLTPTLMLSKLVSTLKLSVSAVTAHITPQEQQLLHQFQMWTEGKIIKKRLELAKDRSCLMLIHPKWRHGYQALFPDCTAAEEWREMTATAFPLTPESDVRTKVTTSTSSGDWHFRRKQPQQDLGVSPRNTPAEKMEEQPCCTVSATCAQNQQSKQMSPKGKDQSFPDAVDVSSWQKACGTDKRPWKEEGGLVAERCCSLEGEFALDRDLLGFEDTQCGGGSGSRGGERDTCSEKESRLDSATSYGGGTSSPAHSSTTKQQNKPSVQEAASEIVHSSTVAPVQLAVTEAGTSSSNTTPPSTVAASVQRSSTFSLSPSNSIEDQEGGGVQRKADLVQKRTVYETTLVMGGGQQLERDLQQGAVHVTTPRHAGASEFQCSPRIMKNFSKMEHEIRPPPSYLQGAGPEVPDAKRSRTKYNVSSTKPVMRPITSPCPGEQSVLTPPAALQHKSNRRHPRESDSPLKHRHSTPVESNTRTFLAEKGAPCEELNAVGRLGPLLPTTGFGWNVEWSGPLYLAGPIIRQSEPQKLFHMEILCKRTLSMPTAWPSELVVHTIDRKEKHSCPLSCMINLTWESLTEIGRTFGKWLTENKMIAIVDLPGEKSSRLIIFVQDSSTYCGSGQLVAGFQRDCTTI